jgi:hypothetical protein
VSVNYLQSADGGLMVDINTAGGVRSGSALQVLERKSEWNQWWTMEAVEGWSGYFWIRSSDGGLVIDISTADGGVKSGSRLQALTKKLESNQYWTTEDVPGKPGYFWIVSADGGLVIDIDNSGGVRSGSVLQALEKKNETNQYWKWVEVPKVTAPSVMIRSNLTGINTGINNDSNSNVIEIRGNSMQAGAGLDAAQAQAGFTLSPTPEHLATGQTWQVLPDPAGSTHHIIKNPATGLCINIANNSGKTGTALNTWPVQSQDHANQLWDFLPDQFGSGSCFIQNPHTGYVIEVAGGSPDAGAALVVGRRRMFGNQHQLWYAVGEQFDEVSLPSLEMQAPPVPPSEFGSDEQYTLVAPSQSTNLTSVVVAVDVIEELVADSFSIQINGNAPAPGSKVDAKWFAQWLQYGLVMENNELVLFTQVWNFNVPANASDPLPSADEWSGSMLQLQDNKVPAGTRILLTLVIEHGDEDFATGVTGEVLKDGVRVGGPLLWSAIGKTAFHGDHVVQKADLAPLGALQVVVVGAPGGATSFSSGMGTITVSCDPAVTVSSDENGPNPVGIGTGETSNLYYGELQKGSFNQIVQPFGVLSPKMTGTGGEDVWGTGLYPNSKLHAKASYSGDAFATPIEGIIGQLPPSAADGSFALQVYPQNAAANYTSDTLAVTVTDSEGNSAWCTIANGVGFPKLLGTGGTPRPHWGDV